MPKFKFRKSRSAPSRDIDWTIGNYVYVPSGPTDSRSPCPALNALANHNILPHDGRNLHFLQVMRAIQAVYTLSTPLAFLLTLGGFLLCGNITSFFNKINLHDLALHNRVEHDASLVHDNAKEGEKYAPVKVDPVLLEEFVMSGGDPELKRDVKVAMDMRAASPSTTVDTYHDIEKKEHLPPSSPPASPSSAPGLTLYTLAHFRSKRQMTSPPLNLFHTFLARGESALTLLTLGDQYGFVSPELVKVWFGEERLPDGWRGTVSGWKTTFSEVDSVAKRVGQVVAHLSSGV